MKIHEYQAKELFRHGNIAVPRGTVAFSINEATAIAEALDHYPVVVKAQIHAGGRGKGGGVKLAYSLAEVESTVAGMLNMKLVTPQTGPDGRLVRKVLVEEGLTIVRELYLSMLPDRTTAHIIIMASQAGGMDIEETATASPEKIVRTAVNPLAGLQPYHCRELAFGLDLEPEVAQHFYTMISNLYKLFVSLDCSLVEINPLVVTAENSIIALDAKIDLDSNAIYRHKDLQELRDTDEEDPLEVEASRFNLNYINLAGNVGNMVNGAGLAMATMDIIKKAGAEPANFLDVGGGASAEMVENGLRLILADKNVKAVLINIFGGILRCDVLAEGVVQAARKTGISVPVVIRMEGTNVEEGRRILAESGLNFITAVDLKDAAARIAEIAGRNP